jgi:hypothetical protein
MARSGFVGHVWAPASIAANPSPTTASSFKESGFMTSSFTLLGVASSAEFTVEL